MGNPIKNNQAYDFSGYYDGIPQNIQDMTPEMLEKEIQKEKEKLAKLNAGK